MQITDIGKNSLPKLSKSVAYLGTLKNVVSPL